ncbi:hypothetical protein FVE85_8047 [Porphyridium purpureum]|uniref:Uncharacterized protein n=1 Tax=Porphyridium purpureum TaxID=35688 RepID=A0A5J4YNM5_PORPP|nr:hypothetical protein FVE85_8047 [Porphyridium purpureum]|eukprot:POR5633..scf295_9
MEEQDSERVSSDAVLANELLERFRAEAATRARGCCGMAWRATRPRRSGGPADGGGGHSGSRPQDAHLHDGDETFFRFVGNDHAVYHRDTASLNNSHANIEISFQAAAPKYHKNTKSRNRSRTISREPSFHDDTLNAPANVRKPSSATTEQEDGPVFRSITQSSLNNAQADGSNTSSPNAFLSPRLIHPRSATEQFSSPGSARGFELHEQDLSLEDSLVMGKGTLVMNLNEIAKAAADMKAGAHVAPDFSLRFDSEGVPEVPDSQPSPTQQSGFRTPESELSRSSLHSSKLWQQRENLLVSPRAVKSPRVVRSPGLMMSPRSPQLPSGAAAAGSGAGGQQLLYSLKSPRKMDAGDTAVKGNDVPNSSSKAGSLARPPAAPVHGRQAGSQTEPVVLRTSDGVHKSRSLDPKVPLLARSLIASASSSEVPAGEGGSGSLLKAKTAGSKPSNSTQGAHNSLRTSGSNMLRSHAADNTAISPRARSSPLRPCDSDGREVCAGDALSPSASASAAAFADQANIGQKPPTALMRHLSQKLMSKRASHMQARAESKDSHDAGARHAGPGLLHGRSFRHLSAESRAASKDRESILDSEPSPRQPKHYMMNSLSRVKLPHVDNGAAASLSPRAQKTNSPWFEKQASK